MVVVVMVDEFTCLLWASWLGAVSMVVGGGDWCNRMVHECHDVDDDDDANSKPTWFLHANFVTIYVCILCYTAKGEERGRISCWACTRFSAC